MIVKNTGEAAAIEVKPSSLTVQVGQSEPQLLKIAHESIILNSGEQGTFSWTYNAPSNITEETLVSFHGSSTGKDNNSKLQVDSEPSESVEVTVTPLPALTITEFTVDQNQISEGQTMGMEANRRTD